MNLYLQSTQTRDALDEACEKPRRTRCAIAALIGTVETVTTVAKAFFSSMAVLASLGLCKKARETFHYNILKLPSILIGISLAVAGCVYPLWVKKFTALAEAKVMARAQHLQGEALNRFETSLSDYLAQAKRDAAARGDAVVRFDVDPVRNRVRLATAMTLENFNRNHDKGVALDFLATQLRQIVQQHTTQEGLSALIVRQSVQNSVRTQQAQQLYDHLVRQKKAEFDQWVLSIEHRPYCEELRQKLGNAFQQQIQSLAAPLEEMKQAKDAESYFEDFSQRVEQLEEEWQNIQRVALETARLRSDCFDKIRLHAKRLLEQCEKRVQKMNPHAIDLPLLRKELETAIAQREAELLHSVSEDNSTDALNLSLEHLCEWTLDDHLGAALAVALEAKAQELKTRALHRNQVISEARRLSQEQKIHLKQLLDSREAEVEALADKATLDLATLKDGFHKLLRERNNFLDKWVQDLQSVDPIDPFFNEMQDEWKAYLKQVEGRTLKPLVEIETAALNCHQEKIKELLKTVPKEIKEHLAAVKKQSEEFLSKSAKSHGHAPTLRKAFDDLFTTRKASLENQLKALQEAPSTLSSLAELKRSLVFYRLDQDNSDVKKAQELAKSRLVTLEEKSAWIQAHLDQAYSILSNTVREKVLQQFHQRFQEDMGRLQELRPDLNEAELRLAFYRGESPEGIERKIRQAIWTQLQAVLEENQTIYEECHRRLLESKADMDLDSFCEKTLRDIEARQKPRAERIERVAREAYPSPL